MKVKMWDTVSSDACPKCGSKGWIIDGPSFQAERDKVWLLCLDPKNEGCVETKELDPDLE